METANISKVLQLFNMLSISEQIEIADKIGKQTFEDRWRLLDINLPNLNFSDEEIMKEVRVVRYTGK